MMKRIEDSMIQNYLISDPGDDVSTVLDEMDNLEAECAIVMNGDEIMGQLLITEIIEYLQGKSIDNLAVKDIMSPKIMCCSPRSDSEVITAVMEVFNIEYTPVIFDKEIVGLFKGCEIQ